jgi:STE24 endopeptidase
MEDAVFITIVAIMILSFVLGRVLDYLNLKTWKKELPEDISDYYSAEEYIRAKEYYKVRDRLSLISSSLSFLLMLLFFIFGGFAWLHNLLLPYFSHVIPLALVYFGILFFVSDWLGIPFSLYSTFVIEEKFGFNKTTPKIFILDKLKSYMLTLIIGGGLCALLLYLIQILGNNFWLVAFVVIMTFSLFFSVFYSTLIIPLFNKLKPLEEGELRTAIENYARTVDFPLTNIYVIDGSKRSSKANAFFTGLWKKKKVVLYDTLIEKHETDELVAILAHEIGHYKKKHIIKGMVLSGVQSFIMLYLLSLIIFEPVLSAAFGITNGASVLHINLIAFAMLFEPINLLTGLLGNFISRKHEYSADAFAVHTTQTTKLADALKRLSVNHLSNLKPHPAYVFFHYSHPPVLLRLHAIRNQISQ